MRSFTPRTVSGQRVRKLTGLRGESLVRTLLNRDRKLNQRYHVHISRERGKVPGLDVKLYKKTLECKVDPDREGCLLEEGIEVKTIEKLFEHEKSRVWPHSRESRFVLKPSEKPKCYAFVAEDELTHHTVVDFVDSNRVLNWMSHLQSSKTPKLPVRAVVALRRSPCPLVSKSHFVIPHQHGGIR